MNVVISAGGRFHAHRLAQQLATRDSLRKLFTFDYEKKDTAFVPPAMVQTITSCKIMNDLFVRCQLARFVNKTYFNNIKDNIFDRLVAQKLNRLEPFDLFVGWAHYVNSCIPIAKKRGALVVLESGSCHIVHQEALLQQEYDRWGISFRPIYAPTKEKMLAEYQQADYIMTLSSFAQKSFIAQGLPTQKIRMVPCGSDVAYFIPQQPMNAIIAERKKKFRVLFVGLVALRKGVQYLLEAWHKAGLPPNQTELIIVGALQQDFMQIIKQLPISANVTFVGPTDRATLQKYYQQASVFVLPSIEEGFGMVIGEAMASGLPVICSINSAGPDLIVHQQHGFLIPAGKSDNIAHWLTWCYNNQDEAAVMGLHAQQHIQAWTWERYGGAIYDEYQRILQGA